MTNRGLYVSPTTEVFYPRLQKYADFTIPVEKIFDLNGHLVHIGVPRGEDVFGFFFRSRLRPDVDPETLLALDEKALIAAENTEGFIHYQPFDGLSYCYWASPEQARVATSSPEHREAAKYAREAYEEYQLILYKIARPAVGNVVNISDRWLMQHWHRPDSAAA